MVNSKQSCHIDTAKLKACSQGCGARVWGIAACLHRREGKTRESREMTEVAVRAGLFDGKPRAGAVIGGQGLMGSTHNECCEKKSCHDWKCVLTRNLA